MSEGKIDYQNVAHTIAAWTVDRTPLEAVEALYRTAADCPTYGAHMADTYIAAADTIVEACGDYCTGGRQDLIERTRRLLDSIEASRRKLAEAGPEPVNTRAVA